MADSVVTGSPSKAFFVNMIAKDIALGDAPSTPWTILLMA